MGSKEVEAGGAYVRVFVKNEDLDQGLADANQKIRRGLTVAKSALVSAGSSVGAAAVVGYGAIATIGKGVASAIGTTATRVNSIVMSQTSGLNATAKALEHLTPVGTRTWDFLQGGTLRATKALGVFRQLLQAAGPAADPLLTALDGISQKTASIAGRAKWFSIITGDKQGASDYRALQRIGQDAILSGPGRGGDKMRILQDRAAEMIGKGIRSLSNVTGLSKLIGQSRSLATSLIKIPFRTTTAGVAALGNESLKAAPKLGRAEAMISRVRSAASSLFSTLRSGSGSLGKLSAGILGPLAAIGAFHAGGITELFTAKGFAQHASEIADRAKAHSVSVEYQSALEAAEKLSGIKFDDTVANEDDSHEERSKKTAKRNELKSHMGNAVHLGAVITTEQAKTAKEATTALAAMSIAFRSVGTAIGSAVLPQITKSVKWVTDLSVGIAGFISKNPTLIQQIYMVGTAMGFAAAMGGALATVVLMASSPIGIAALAVGGFALGVGALTAAFMAFGGNFKSTLAPVFKGIDQLKETFNTTFGGIVDALASGNLSLAATVAWAGLKAVFNEGVAWLDDKWLAFKDATLGIFGDIVTGFRIALNEMFPGFEKEFSGMLGFLADSWTVGVNFLLNAWDIGVAAVANTWTMAVNGFMSVWDTAVGWITKSLHYIQKLWDTTFDLKGANAAVDAKVAAAAKQRGIDQKTAIEGRNNALNDKLTERQNKQNDLLNQRQQARDARNAQIDQNGAASVLTGENAAAKLARANASKTARERDQDAVFQAKRDLRIAALQAKRNRIEQNIPMEEEIEKGRKDAKKGAEKAETKGLDAHDIRSKEGLSLIANTARGHTTSTYTLMGKQVTLLDSIAKTLNQSNFYDQKNWQNIEKIAMNTPAQATPVAGIA